MPQIDGNNREPADGLQKCSGLIEYQNTADSMMAKESFTIVIAYNNYNHYVPCG